MRKILKYSTRNLIKMRKKSKNLLELLFVIFSLIIIGYLIYVINAPPAKQQGGLALLRISLTSTGKPILIVSLEPQELKEENGACFSVIKGSVKNTGDRDAEDAVITCEPPILSFSENIQASKEIGSIAAGQKSPFEIEKEVECGKEIRLICSAECGNC